MCPKGEGFITIIVTNYGSVGHSILFSGRNSVKISIMMRGSFTPGWLTRICGMSSSYLAMATTQRCRTNTDPHVLNRSIRFLPSIFCLLASTRATSTSSRWPDVMTWEATLSRSHRLAYVTSHKAERPRRLEATNSLSTVPWSMTCENACQGVILGWRLGKGHWREPQLPPWQWRAEKAMYSTFPTPYHQCSLSFSNDDHGAAV